MMNAVGGTSLHYWAQSWRLNPWDFKVVSETTRRYGASRIPEGIDGRGLAVRPTTSSSRTTTRSSTRSACRARPATSTARSIARGNIFEGPRAREYPMPPLRGTRLHRHDGDGGRAASAGIRFRGRRAINSRTYQGRSACMYHGFCNKGGCHVDAKNSTAVTTIPKAQKTGHLKVVTRAHVTTIEVDAQRPRDRRDLRHRRHRVLPAGEGRAARELHLREHRGLLLLSKSKAFPNGLSNNHGQVGRHYFSHNQAAA